VDPGRFPQTRYQGSKRKVAARIVETLCRRPFQTVLDAFGGTGSVSYALKRAGKSVTYNDILEFNLQTGRGLIENRSVRLAEDRIRGIGHRRSDEAYGDFIERTFAGIYFTPGENRWLDVAVGNVRAIPCPYQRALAWHALFQAAIIKRPYNLFHRKNLYLRSARVKRSFGNKASWDRPFETHFRRFAAEANAAVFDSGTACRAVASDALEVAGRFDLVYIDPPYINRQGVGVDYRDFYHFLEGMIRYDEWPKLVDYSSRHRRLHRRPSGWSDPRTAPRLFRSLFDRFRDSILAVSYRSDGVPSIEELTRMLADFKRDVRVLSLDRNQYALSTRRDTHEMLLIGV
jgi:adenine-specific DNA methylase